MANPIVAEQIYMTPELRHWQHTRNIYSSVQ